MQFCVRFCRIDLINAILAAARIAAGFIVTLFLLLQEEQNGAADGASPPVCRVVLWFMFRAMYQRAVLSRRYIALQHRQRIAEGFFPGGNMVWRAPGAALLPGDLCRGKAMRHCVIQQGPDTTVRRRL